MQQIRAADATPKVTLPQINVRNGYEERNHSQLQQGTQSNEPKRESELGDDGKQHSIDRFINGDSLVNVDTVIQNFRKLASLRLRGNTPRQYEYTFSRFADSVNLRTFSRRQLAGKMGRELLVRYLLEQIPAPSRRTVNASLKAVWTEGLDLPYPVLKKDLGELPEVQRRQSPRDTEVLPWVAAIEHEEDAYLKTIVLLVFQLGIRPSHVCLLKWHHLRYGIDGRPESLVTSGREMGNKRMVPIKARIPPDLGEALIALKKGCSDSLPEDPVLRLRKRSGELVRSHMRAVNYEWQWERFRAKHLLGYLRPVDLRHWVSTLCRRAGLSYAATNALQGHKCTSLNMRDHYDRPSDEELFEEQARVLPSGPIGFLCPKIEVDQALPVELTQALADCLSGKILPQQLTETVMAYLVRQIKKTATLVT